jgi:hypothetical protein
MVYKENGEEWISQGSVQNDLIFRLLLKITVNWILVAIETFFACGYAAFLINRISSSLSKL